MEKLYSIRLIDYGCPSFISNITTYVGTKKEIESVMTELSKQDNQDYIQNAVKDYFSNGDGIVSVLYEKPAPIIENVEIKKEKSLCIDDFKYTFFNIWGCPYELQADKMEVKLLYLKIKDKYYKYCYYKFLNLGYLTKNKQMEEYLQLFNKKDELVFGRLFWGHPGVVVQEENATKNVLACLEKTFNNYKDLLEDYKNVEKVDCERFFFDVFGDG